MFAISIIDITCQNNYINKTLKHNIIKLSKPIIIQNYFQFLDKTYIQPEGLALGAPTSSIFSELYLQYLENTTIFNLLLDYNIKGYFRYTTNIDELLDHFNNLSPKLNFTIEKEENHKINFLDVTITRDPNKLSVDIYIKPAYTDVIIPCDSCHPKEQKLAAIQYLHNRMNTYHLSPENFERRKTQYNLSCIIMVMIFQP
jgi:hypothetical protein